jgi:hypothetical protein
MLHFAGQAEPDHLLTGARVRVNGIRLGQTLAAGGTGSVKPVAMVLTSLRFGPMGSHGTTGSPAFHLQFAQRPAVAALPVDHP